MMWQFLQSKLTNLLTGAVVAGTFYLVGLNHGSARSELKCRNTEIEIQKGQILQLQYFKSLAESTQLALHKERESNALLFQRLYHEIDILNDGLDTCKLSDVRLRNIVAASKNTMPVPASSGRTKTESNRESADIPGMSCAGLHKSYLACAEKYAECYSGYTKLWEWSSQVGNQ